MRAELGLLLLTGGRGARLGGPKHDRPHPAGGTWGGHLVRVFRTLAPEGPVHLLGAALPDWPELDPQPDPRQGPAVALGTWAEGPGPSAAARWWVVACDLPRWTPEALEAWWRRARAADPLGERWVVARVGGRLQPLGGFLPAGLSEVLAQNPRRRLVEQVEALPHQILTERGSVWLDVDEPEALVDFMGNAL